MPEPSAIPKPSRFEMPPLGKPYLLGFDQDNSAYPILAVHLDPRVGNGQVIPADLSACPYAGYTSLVFVGQKTVQEGVRVMRTYRILPGATASSQSYSNRGDAITVSEQEMASGTTLPSQSLTVEVRQQAVDSLIVKQQVTTTPAYGWLYDSRIDPQTGIVGQIAKTYVASSSSNTAGQFTGPETVNGVTFGAAGDLVIVDYEAYNTLKQTLMVSVFSKTQIALISEVTQISGGYPIPKQLDSVVVHNDSSNWAAATSDGANFSWSIDVPINGQLELIWTNPPLKLTGTRTRTYSIGAPLSIPSNTIMVPASGEIVMKGASLKANSASWENSSSAGQSSAGSVATQYGIIHIPDCLVNATTVFGSLPAASIPTITVELGNIHWSALTGYAGFYTSIASSTPVAIPDTITESATEKQRYNIYAMDVIVWNV